jgi:hypothetical protein
MPRKLGRKLGPRRKHTTPATPTNSNVPHSWPVSNWPLTVYPNDNRKGHYLAREHAAALLQAGALVRIGRERVIIGEPYVRWLARQATRVPGYQIAPNRADQPAA